MLWGPRTPLGAAKAARGTGGRMLEVLVCKSLPPKVFGSEELSKMKEGCKGCCYGSPQHPLGLPKAERGHGGECWKFLFVKVFPQIIWDLGRLSKMKGDLKICQGMLFGHTGSQSCQIGARLRFTGTLARDGRMQPEGTGLVKAELEVEFPIEGFRTGKEGGEDVGKEGNTEHHGIRASCRKLRMIRRIPPFARVRLDRCETRGGRQGQKVPCISLLSVKRRQGRRELLQEVGTKQDITFQDQDDLVAGGYRFACHGDPIPQQRKLSGLQVLIVEVQRSPAIPGRPRIIPIPYLFALEKWIIPITIQGHRVLAGVDPMVAKPLDEIRGTIRFSCRIAENVDMVDRSRESHVNTMEIVGDPSLGPR